MYTRSYPRQEQRKEPPPNESIFTSAPARRVLSENDIPKGYSGTAILRESEPPLQAVNTPLPPVQEHSAPPRDAPITRVRRLKTATKISPSLLHRPVATESEPECETEKQCDADCPVALSECDRQRQESREKEYCDGERCKNEESAECEDSCECNEKKPYHGAHSQTSIRHIKRARRLRKKEDKCMRGEGLRDRTFSLEDLLLGGLILLMLNEGADDDVILMLGFLLFSAL